MQNPKYFTRKPNNKKNNNNNKIVLSMCEGLIFVAETANASGGVISEMQTRAAWST